MDKNKDGKLGIQEAIDSIMSGVFSGLSYTEEKA